MKKRRTAKQLRLDFSNCVIVYCIAYMSVYLWRCLDVLTTTETNPTTCVTAAAGFFGGELLMVCLAYKFEISGGIIGKHKTEHTYSNDDIDAMI